MPRGERCPETLLSASHETSPLDPHSSAGGTGVLFSLAVQIRTMRHREVYASLWVAQPTVGSVICKQGRGRQVGRTHVPERQGTLVKFYSVTTGPLLDMWTHWRGGT